jgi:hypothetical protein
MGAAAAAADSLKNCALVNMGIIPLLSTRA